MSQYFTHRPYCVFSLSHHLNPINPDNPVPHLHVVTCHLCVISEGAGKGAKAGGGGGGGGNDDDVAPSRLDIRVGKIISVEKVGREERYLMPDQLISKAFLQMMCVEMIHLYYCPLSVCSHGFLCCPPSSIRMLIRCTWRRLMWESRSQGRWSAGWWPIFHRRTYRTEWCWCCAI